MTSDHEEALEMMMHLHCGGSDPCAHRPDLSKLQTLDMCIL